MDVREVYYMGRKFIVVQLDSGGYLMLPEEDAVRLWEKLTPFIPVP